MATYVAPVPIPAERLIRNLEARIKERPDDAEAHYSIARVYYRVFANRMMWVEGFEWPHEPDRLAPEWLSGADVSEEVIKKMAADEAMRELGFLSKRDYEFTKSKDVRIAYLRRFFELQQGLRDLGFANRKIPIAKALEYAGNALWHFNRAIQLDNGNPWYHLGLASLLDQLREFA